MKTSTLTTHHLLISLLVVLLSAFSIVAQTTTFIYQGRLPAEQHPQTGLYDLQFNLYDESSGTNSPLNMTPVVLENVQVTNSTFTVSLNFGSLFNTGADRYLELGVRDGDSTGAFTIVSPRTQILSVPYAIRSLSAVTADTATNAQNLGGTPADNFVQNDDSRLTDARTPTVGSGNYIQNTNSVQSGANFNIDGTGTANVFNSTSEFRVGGLRVLSVPGEDNLFVGINSGSSNTDGNNNSFVGYHSGFQNTTGFRNSFFGPYAGFNNTTGHNNTFVGAAAGNGNTTGNYNIFIGESTSLNNVAGNHNTIIGSLAAGQFSSSPGFFATAIGAGSRVSSSDTIVLGKTAGVYDGISRPSDTVQIPGHLEVTGSITASTFNGSGLTNINASNITTGTLDNARLNLVPINKGGTGLTSAGANGNFLRSNGTSLTSSLLQLGDIPDLSASYIRNQTGPAQSGGFNLSGNGTAGIFNATTQFNINNNRVLSIAGTGNTFAGVNAGASNATGPNNSFFGQDAGTDNNSGADNSFFGVQSGRQNTSGGNNTFVGVNTGYGNTAGHSNSFVGMQAGQSNTTGHNNSFFGYTAGINNATGNFNTVLGSNASVGSDNLSYASAIGSGAVVNASDMIVLGKPAGVYDGVSRPSDSVQIPGNLNVVGTISGNINGSSLTNLNASNITSGMLGDARLSSNVATLSGAQTFIGLKTFASGINGTGSGLTDLNADNITNGTLDNSRLGVVGVTNGGTGLTTSGASGNFLRSNGTAFTSSVLAATDIPAGSISYIQNTSTQQPSSNFNISGNGAVGGNFSVVGTLNANGGSLTNLNAANITTGILDNARFGSISTSNIADDSITAVKLANSSVTTQKIADSALTAAKIGVNQVVKNLNGLTDNVNLVAGANVTITPSGNVLTIAATGGNFIQNTTTQQPGSNFNISGDGSAANLTAGSMVSGNVVNAATQFNLGGNRVLSAVGTNNLFAGNGTGAANTTGYGNSFFGTTAGLNNTIGEANSFVGFQAGLKNTAGFYNTFFGYGSGNSNVTGFNNSFVGFQAGFHNTESGNSFFGSFAGYSNTTGYYNSFVGNGAGNDNTEGSQNTFIGVAAGGKNTTGFTNLFAGSSSGNNNTTGYNNSFVGTNSGGTNTTGNSNTLLGAYANVAANNLYFAAAIGSEATVSTNNTIVLGRSVGYDMVQIPGLLKLNTLGTAGGNSLCRNASNQVAACSSSLRYKKNIAPFPFGLNLVRRLHPIRFEWKDSGMKDLGFGAEDVATVEPLLVTYNMQGQVEGVKYDRISALLVNAVQEQQTQIEAQQKQLEQQQLQIRAQQIQLTQQQTLIDGLKKLLCRQNGPADVCH